MNPSPGGPWYPPPQQPPPPQKRRLPGWAWVLITLGALAVLTGAGTFGLLIYIGSVGPETHVYTGNQVPKRFVDTIQGLGLLDSGERIRFFYSDGVTDIRNGFSFVSNKKVVVYNQEAVTPATVIQFSEIAAVDLVSSTEWYEDGTITLTLKSGDVVIFPVSSERGGDVQLADAIREEMAKLAPPVGPEE